MQTEGMNNATIDDIVKIASRFFSTLEIKKKYYNIYNINNKCEIKIDYVPERNRLSIGIYNEINSCNILIDLIKKYCLDNNKKLIIFSKSTGLVRYNIIKRERKVKNCWLTSQQIQTPHELTVYK